MQRPPVPPPRAKQKVVFSGWLRKQGGQFKSLRTRWFEIKGDQLYYFKDKSDPKPLGVVPLAGNEVVRYPREESDPGKFRFEIKSGKDRDGRQVIDGHDTFVLIASTFEEMEQWVGVINRIIYQPFGGGMFGGDLAETVRYESRKGGGFVPIIMDSCIEKIRRDGLDEEGLFRLPGNMKATGELKAAFNRGENPDISDISEIHTVASLLKMYLRELPEPLIPYDFFEVFLTSAKCYEMYEDDGIKSIQKHLTQLPKANFNLLKVLCRFLFEVQEHSLKNKMDTRNIAMVFGPNILRSGSEDPQVMMESTGQVTALICILIRRHELFFPQTGDEHHYSRDATNGGDQTGLLIDLDISEDPKSPSGNFYNEENLFSTASNARNSAFSDSQTPEIQVEELENETRLQQQQIKDLKTQLENEKKVREMLVIRLNDEKRAREAAEERLRKMNAEIEAFNVKYGDFTIQ